MIRDFGYRYSEYCLELCGRLIHHDPDGGKRYPSDSQVRKKRFEDTKFSYQARFDKEPSGEIWQEIMPMAPRETRRGVKRERGDEASTVSGTNHRAPYNEDLKGEMSGGVPNPP